MPATPLAHANTLDAERFMQVASPIIETYRQAEQGDEEATAILEALYGYTHSLRIILGDQETIMRLKKETERMRLGYAAEKLVKRANKKLVAAA